MSSRRHAFIVGAAKCGTSTLFDLLGSHPSVCSCSEKEPLFFTLPELYEKGVEWYERLWEYDSALHNIAVEASVTYAEDPNRPCAAPLIKKHFPDALIMYVVRDPIQRIESHYNFIQVTGIPGGSAPITDDFYITGSKYYHQYELYTREFPSDQISVLDFRRLRDDQAELTREVFKFLNLPLHPTFDSRERHAWGTEELRLRRRFLKVAGPFARLLHMVPYGFRQQVKKALGRRTSKRRVQLDDEQVKYVRRALKEDREMFLEVFGWYPDESTLPDVPGVCCR